MNVCLSCRGMKFPDDEAGYENWNRASNDVDWT
jgi:hypothetical protein